MRWLGDLDDQTMWAILLVLTATALGVALAFEHIGDLKPCPLCYQQRWPYYALIVLSIIAFCLLQLAKADISTIVETLKPSSETTQTSNPEHPTMTLERSPHNASRIIGAFLFSRIGLFLAIVLLLVSAGLGAHHAGVEWKWWPGPDACAGGGAAAEAGGSLIERMQAARVVRCDEAAGRFLGLSFAGYNALFSLGLAALLALHFYFKPSGHNYIAAENVRSPRLP